ncbi:MAG TPA: sensor domain-containing diguanylate cyclase [Candidatus Limnocylindrales bacterium]
MSIPSTAEYRLLAECARIVAASDDLDRVLGGLVEAVAAHVGADAATVFLLDQDGDSLELVASTGVGAADGEVRLGSLDDESDPVARAARERRPVDVDADDPRRGPLVERCGLQAGSFRPLVVTRGGIDLAVGVLGLCWAGPLPDDEALAVIEPVADLAAVAVDRTRATSLGMERAEWLERLAHTDPLTGLANRRTLDRMLELELARAGRQGGEVTLAMFDVDAFGATVESSGRAAGDDVLRSVAAVLAESVRLVDTVARYGPDEFVLLAPGAAGTVVAERVLAGVAALAPVAGQPVSVSAGVVHFPRDGATASELLAAAEATVGAATAGGGGRIATPQLG